jgi:hypothetical protein
MESDIYIGNPSDALFYLDQILDPDCVESQQQIEAIIRAVRDAIARGII